MFLPASYKINKNGWRKWWHFFPVMCCLNKRSTLEGAPQGPFSGGLNLSNRTVQVLSWAQKPQCLLGFYRYGWRKWWQMQQKTPSLWRGRCALMGRFYFGLILSIMYLNVDINTAEF